MKNIFGKVATLFLGFLFAILFHKQLTGVNLLIYQLIFISYLCLIWRPKLLWNTLGILILSNILLQFAVVIQGSNVAKIMSWISFFAVTGTIIQPDLKNVFNSLKNYFGNSAVGIRRLFKSQKNNNSKNFRLLPFLKIIIIPLIILLVFSLIYRSANPIFNDYIKSISTQIYKFFGRLDFTFIFLFVLGIFLSAIAALNASNKWNTISKAEAKSSVHLLRKRRFNQFSSMIGLKTEYKSVVFLFIGLNVLILFFNITDIQHLWINFKWDGGFLKSFVHEGTYLLICSLVLSIIITVYSFRRNLNFLQKNKLLKVLAVVWLSQNIFMLFSVALRNYHYIQHFALAHKRIGVYFFLLICLVGLITCIIKVWHKKSYYYLEKTNALYIYLILVVMACFNWDIIIAKYNFENYKNSFLHLPYMLNLSDKALPYIEFTPEQLNHMDSIQNRKFKFESRGYHKKVEYTTTFKKRKSHFLKHYESRHWLSWNYADYKAYKLLSKKKE